MLSKDLLFTVVELFLNAIKGKYLDRRGLFFYITMTTRFELHFYFIFYNFCQGDFRLTFIFDFILLFLTTGIFFCKCKESLFLDIKLIY